MSHADAAIGMMDGAYFTSRNDILNFLNDLLNLNLRKIEETASGAVACQLTEYIFPGSIPMSRVNWAAKSSHEYVANYKLLQNGFNKNKIQKHVDVDKLIRGKYQDNLEFCQWLKAFFDQTAPMMRAGREGYDPAAVRAKGKGGKTVGTNKGGGGPVRKTSSASRSGASARPAGATTTRPAVKKSTTGTAGSSSRPASGGSSASSSARGQKENTANSSSSRMTARAPSNNPRKASASSVSSATVAKYEKEINELKSETTSLKTKYSELERASAEVEISLQTVEGERDFYFEKLRGIEVMLQVYKEKEDEAQGSGDVTKVMNSIFKVMYATMEDNVMVTDEGDLLGDITIESSINQSALSAKVHDDFVDEDEEDEDLLVDNVNEPVIDDERAIENQFSDDDLGDDELLTADFDEPVIKGVEQASAENYVDDSEFVKAPLVVEDDYSDEDLLAD